MSLPLPPGDHPRLLLRPGDLPALRARLAAPSMRAVRDALFQQASAGSDAPLPDGRPDSADHEARRRAFEAQALLCLLSGEEVRGRRAIEMTLGYFRSIAGTYDRDGLFASRAMNRTIFGAAMVYDWCYPLLVAGERADLLREALRVAAATEYGWPPHGVGFVSGHYGEEKHPAMLALGIAVHDEDPMIYDSMAGQLYEKLAPVRDFFYPGGKHHQGNAYGVVRLASEVEASFLMTRMGAPRPTTADPSQVAYWFLYLRRPDGLLMTEGDDFSRKAGPGWFTPPELLFMAASMSRDPHLQAEALRYGGTIGDAALRLLVQDDVLDARPPDDLPLTRYFGSPFGAMVARTDWSMEGGQDARTAIAQFHVKEYQFGNHDHLDAGHFAIYCRGTLAVDSGVYEGTHGLYGGDHFYNYYQRTVAHNTLLILDPDEPRPRHFGREVEARDGGQFWPDGEVTEFRNLGHLLAKGKRAEILAHAIGPDPIRPEYSYLKGDIAPAYHAPEPYPPKVSEARRAFVFLNVGDTNVPAALIVFDRVTSCWASFGKRWLLHSVEEPQVADGLTTIPGRGARSRLVVHTLLPGAGDRRIVKVGGPGSEFRVDGRNYPNPPLRRPDLHEPGAWRIELSPGEARETDLFLNVLMVVDGAPEPEAPVMLDDGELVGVAVADRAVLFSRSAGRLGGVLAFTLPDGGPERWKVLVTDLQTGRWQVSGPVEEERTATAEGGAIDFAGPPGSYRLTLREEG